MTTSTLALLVTALLSVNGPAAPAPPCHRVADLSPQASRGELRATPSAFSESGQVMRWSAGEGETLQLTLRAEDSGLYAVTLFAVHRSTGPALTAKLWDDPLLVNGESHIALHAPSDGELRGIELDEVSLGPGHHLLELTCVAPGDVLLDCVMLKRVGEYVTRDSADGDRRPFLGIEMGETAGGGVTIANALPGAAAAEAGIQAGDVLLRLDGESMTGRDVLLDAILRHRPGDRIALALLREGTPLEMDVTLGRRTRTTGRRGARSTHVIDFLDVEPGEVIADIGCGDGWLSEAIAQSTDAGPVYAVEIQEKHVRRLHRWKIPDIVPVYSRADDVSLPVNSLDTAILHDVASHVKRPARPRFYGSVARALKPGGRLVIFGPHGKGRKMLEQLAEHGFIPVNDEELAAMSQEMLDKQLWEGIVFCHVDDGTG